MIKAIVKRPGEKPEITEIKDELATYQELVEGYIQVISIPEETTAIENVDIILNEEGKLRGMEANMVMPEYADVLVGPLVFVGSKPYEGKFCSLTDEQMEKVLWYIEDNQL